MGLMIGFRTFATALALTATLGLTACGGDDEETENASQRLQQQGVEKRSADELAQTAQDLEDRGFSQEDAAKLKAATASVQQEVNGLQRRIVQVTRDVQAGRLTEEQGQSRIAALAEQIQRRALGAAEELDRAGALPPSAKAQVEAARKRLAEADAEAEKK